MSFHRWLQNLRTALAPRRGQRRHARRGSKRAPTHRPGLEILEVRCVPAFLAPVDYPVIASFAVDAEASDFNGDAVLDLATVGQDGVVSVLLGNPDGTFQPALYTGAGTSAASPSLAVGDFNEDGKLDLATNSNAYYGYSFDDVVVLLGNGDGTFVPRNLGTHLAAAAVATGDVNGDGHVDLVVGSWGDDFLSVLIGGGDGTFAPPTTYDGPYPEDFTSVALADFDADGNLDQAYLDEVGLAVSLSNGDGSFAPPISTSVGYGPRFLVVDDFNADGRPDAALCHPGTWSGPTPYGVVTVLLNDGVWPPSVPLLTIDDVALTEGNSGTASATFTVTLSPPSDQPVTVAYATADGSATAGSDYQAAGGTLTFAPGATTGTLTVLVNGDRLGEGWESFFVNLGGATNAIIADGHGVGIIHDDEPRISIGDATLTEGDTGTVNATFLVTLWEASPFDVPFQYATGDMTAAAGRDYTATSGTVTIPAGQTSATVTVPVKGDRLVEPTETFAVYLTAATGATIIDREGVGTILDNDAYPLVSISDVSKAEGKKGKTTAFTFTVTLSAPYDERVTLSFQTANGTATTGDNDYVARSGTLTFFPGETTKTITVEVKGDGKIETNETFSLDLFGLSGNAVFTNNRGTGTILNDD